MLRSGHQEKSKVEVGEVGSLRIVISAELQSTINARRCNSSLKYQPSLIMPHYGSLQKIHILYTYSSLRYISTGNM